MTNKEVAKTFLTMAASGEIKPAYDRFIAPNFTHHNLYFKGDRQSLMDAMLESDKKDPNKSFEIQKTYEDGDTVITHSLVRRKTADSIAVVHICKIQGGKILEMWDIGTLIPKDSPNENGPF